MHNFELNWPTFILAIVVVILTSILFSMRRNTKKWRKSHEENMQILREAIVVLLDQSKQQSNKIELNKELEQKLRAATQIVSQDLFATLEECIQKLSQNDLLAK